MLDGQHGILVTENNEIIEMGYNATPKDLAYAMKRNWEHHPRECLIIPIGEEHNAKVSKDILLALNTIFEELINPLGLPLHNANFMASAEVALTDILPTKTFPSLP